MRGVPGTDGWVWSADDAHRLHAAFAKRFGEDVPRTETLYAVAAEAIRIYVERTAPEPATSGENISLDMLVRMAGKD
jgi:hypothetical protein